jgi:hypothetical protein
MEEDSGVNGDRNVLIEGPVIQVHANTGEYRQFLLFKFTTVMLFAFSVWLNHYPLMGILLVCTSAFVEFWFCKNRDGLEYVGMRWCQEIGDEGSPRWIFYSRKDPYVPRRLDTRIFWSGLFTSTTVWAILAIWSLVVFGWFFSTIALFVLSLECINVWAFLQCQRSASKHIEDMTRIVLGIGKEFDSDNLEPEPEVEEVAAPTAEDAPEQEGSQVSLPTAVNNTESG